MSRTLSPTELLLRGGHGNRTRHSILAGNARHLGHCPPFAAGHAPRKEAHPFRPTAASCTTKEVCKCMVTAEYRRKTMTVPPPGLEPGRMRIHWHLKPARLPFRHKGKADEVGVEPTAPVKERRFSGPAETTVPQLVHTFARVMLGEQS